MADLLKLNNLFQFPSIFNKSRFPLHNLSPFSRRISLLTNFSSPSNSTSVSHNLLLISTSVELDGSLVFKFGDASEIPPVVQKDEDFDTISDDSGIEVKTEVQNDVNLGISNVGKEIEDELIPSVVEKDDVFDTISDDSGIEVKTEVQSDVNLGISNVGKEIEDEIPPVIEKDDVFDTISDDFVIEMKTEVQSDVNLGSSNAGKQIEDELIPPVVEKGEAFDTIDDFGNEVKTEGHSDVNLGISNGEKDFDDELIPPVVDKDGIFDTILDVNLGVSNGEKDIEDGIPSVVENVDVLDTIEVKSEIERDDDLAISYVENDVDNVDVLDTISNEFGIEVELETENDANIVVDDQLAMNYVSNVENNVKNVSEVKESSIEVQESNENEGERNQDDLAVALKIEDSGGVNIVEHNDVEKIDVKNLDSEVRLEEEEEEDKEIDYEEIAKVEIIEDGLYGVVEGIEAPLVQLDAENALDEEEASLAGIPSIEGLEDSPMGDTGVAAIPSLTESLVTSTQVVADREQTSSHNGDISASSLSMSSVSHPLTVNDAVPASFPQTDDDRYISEPAGPGLGPNLSGTVSAEANLDSVQLSTVSLSVPSATISLPQDIEVSDAAISSIQQSDDDLCSDSYVAAHPGGGISETTEIDMREEISAPSLCVVSAAASVAQSAEDLAGGDDAYFVYENWFGVADGVGQWSFGGIDKGLYAVEFIQNCERLARESLNTGLNNLKELLQQSAAMTDSSGAARVVIAHIADQVLHVANIGDSGFVIIRNGAVFKKSSPMFHEFNFPYAISSGDNPVEFVEEYHVELEEGDIIVTATDGLFDNLYEREIASLVWKAVVDGNNLKDIAELLAFRSQEVGMSRYARTPFSDAAQSAGHPEFSGGKFDHVTVIVSVARKE